MAGERGELPDTRHPEIGSVWKNNKTGDYYIVLEVTIWEEDLSACVTYFSTTAIYTKWTRNRDVFYEKFTVVN